MIALLTQTFPPATGGMEILCANLARAWAESGREVVVFADSRNLPGEAEFDKSQKFAVRRFAGPRFFRRWRKGRALAEFAAKNPAVAVFTDSWKSVPSSPPPKVSLVCMAHGNDLLEARPDKESRRRRALSRANFIVANSNYTAGLARAAAPDAAQVRVIHPGADLSDASDASRTKSHLLSREIADIVGGADPLLVTIARLEPRKGADAVIRALPILKESHPNIGYLIGGEGGDRARLEKLAEDSGVGGRVFFAGHLSAAGKIAALSAARLFAMPCRRSGSSVEGFGIVFMEAALCGVPSVAGREGGAGEAVLEGETGWLCDGSDDAEVCKTLAAALADGNELARRGAAAKARAEADFAWESAAEKYLALADAAKGGN